MENYLWLIPFAPLCGAIINGLLAISNANSERTVNERLVSFIGCLAPLVSFAVAAGIFLHFRGLPAEERIVSQTLFPWIISGDLHVDFGFMVDALSMVMVLVVYFCRNGHSFLFDRLHARRTTGLRGISRILNLFMFAMLTLVMAKSLPVMFVGWEGVGLCSYLLIGFWYKDIANAAAGKKAFIVNRMGDFAFLIGIFVLFFATVKIGHPTLDFLVLRELVSAHPEAFASRRSRLSASCSLSAPPANPLRSRCMCGCRTRWRARHRSAP